MENRRNVLPYVWMLCGAFAFAAMGTFAHALGQHFDWQLIALSRAIVPLFISAGLAISAGTRLVFWSPVSLWVRSIAGSVSLVCTFFALTRLPVSDVLTLSNLFPIWVAVLSWPLLRQAPSADVWIAVGSGVLGVVLMQQPHIAEGNFASLAALVSSFASAIAMIGLHRLHGIDARAIVFHFSSVSLMFCLAALFLFPRVGSLANAVDGPNLLMLLGVGCSATAGQFCLTKAFTTGPPAKVSVVGLAQVAFGMLFDVLIWGRSFSPLTLLGIAFVTGPTAWLLVNHARRSMADIPCDGNL